MNTISPQELKIKINNNDSFLLVDIREDYEYEDFNIGGINVPFDQVFSSLNKFDADMPIIFICNTGKKSRAIIHTIKRKLQLENVYSLDRGITGYAAEID